MTTEKEVLSDPVFSLSQNSAPEAESAVAVVAAAAEVNNEARLDATSSGTDDAAERPVITIPLEAFNYLCGKNKHLTQENKHLTQENQLLVQQNQLLVQQKHNLVGQIAEIEVMRRELVLKKRISDHKRRRRAMRELGRCKQFVGTVEVLLESGY